MQAATATKDPALDIGALSLNDCRTVCRALKLRAAELRKVGKKLRELERPTEATSLEGEARDIADRLGPRFDEQGTFDFGGKQKPKDDAEQARDRIRRGAK